MSQFSPLERVPDARVFIGLAPFLRRSIAGEDLRPLAQSFLDRANSNADDADSLMNLAVVLQCIGSREAGLSLLGEALSLKATYTLPTCSQPARCRLLLLMVPGDISANTPLDCLLEDSDIELTQHFLHPQAPDLAGLPEHDAIFVAISEGDAFNPLLHWLTDALAKHPRPVLNRPDQIARLGRDEVSLSLGATPGLFIPETHRVDRATVALLGAGSLCLQAVSASLRFPVILRPLGSHGGHGLEKLDAPAELLDYLERMPVPELYLANFIDYRSPDGLFRKMRIILVDGEPFIAHVGISQHWMIHYLNAGMYEDAGKREQEAAFMATFEAFARHHAGALREIHRRSGLDYLCIDCAETADGELFVFEIGNDMVVHAMDPVELFPYKQPIVARIVEAFRTLLLGRIA